MYYQENRENSSTERTFLMQRIKKSSVKMEKSLLSQLDMKNDISKENDINLENNKFKYK